MFESNNPLLRDIYRRVNEKNKNALLSFIGETGSGKSYSALRFAEVLDADFKWHRIVWSPLKFMEILTKDKELHRGNMIIFDEAGVGLPAREWHNIQNKLMDYVNQTFRSDNLIVAYTMPHISFLDIHARKLMHYIFNAEFINYKENKCAMIPYRVVNSLFYDYPFFKKPIFNRFVIRRLNVNLPSQELIDFYEQKKKEFNRNLKEDVYKTLEMLEKIKKERNKDIRDIYQVIVDNLDKYIIINGRGKKVFDKGSIAFDFKLGSKKIETIMAKLKSEHGDLLK